MQVFYIDANGKITTRNNVAPYFSQNVRVAGNLVVDGTFNAVPTDFSATSLILPNVAVPAQTAEGSVVWDSDDDVLTVGDGASRKTMCDTAKAQALSNKTLTTPVIATGLTATGAGSVDFSAATSTFKGPTGACTLNGAVDVNAATTPSITLNSGKTNTGFVLINGKTSGSFKILPADATAQAVVLDIGAQTVGGSTLSIRNHAGVSGNLCTSALSITSKSQTGGIGYETGAAATAVVQGVSKSTAVVANGVCGQITMNNAALIAFNPATGAGKVTFTVNNTAVLANDNIIVNHISAGTDAAYGVYATAPVAATSFNVTVVNNSGGSLSEAIVLQFALVRSPSA